MKLRVRGIRAADTEELEGEAETAEADAEEEKEEPIVDDVEVNAGGQ